MDEVKQSELAKRRKSIEDRKMIFQNLVDIFKQKKLFFLLTLSLALVGTLLGHFLKVQTYNSSATLFVEPENEVSAAGFLLNKNGHTNQHQRLDKYINHLSSDSFLMDVAQKIKFSEDIDSLNLIAPQKKSKLSLGYWKNLVLGNSNEPVKENEEFLVPIEQITAFLRGSVSVEYEYNSPFIHIKTRTLDPRTSLIVANLVASEFTRITNEHTLSEVQEIEAFVLNEKKKTELAIRSLDKQLIEFKQKYNMISTEQSTLNLATRMSDIDSQIQKAELIEKENRKILSLLKKSRENSLNKIFRDGSTNSNFASAETSFIIQERIDQLKNEKSTYLSQGLAENHWRIQKLNTEIDVNVQRLKEVTQDLQSSMNQMNPEKARLKMIELEELLKNTEARISTLTLARAELQKEVEKLPSIQQDYLQIENKFKLEVETLSNLEARLKELEIQKISTKKQVRVDQQARSSSPTPQGSLPAKILFSNLAALFLSLILVLGLEAIDPKIKRRHDLYDCGMEFLGEIPKIETSKTKKNIKKLNFGSPKDLVCKHRPDSIESVAFKYIRARIEGFKVKHKKDSVVLSISSSLHDEGKSFISANLAYSLAQINHKVIIVDADLRRPSQASYFGISSRKGLTDLLSMEMDLNEVLVTDEHPYLDILPAGYSGGESTELLSNNKFRLLIEHLSKVYDYVIVDTPPIFAVVDAAVISSFSDIPILISNYGETRKADLYESYNELLHLSYKDVYGIINRSVVSNSRIHYYGYPMLTSKNDAPPPIAKRDREEEEEFLKKLIS